ncbi:MAG TPA: hypothetical protein VM684_06950, partial [Gaiellales bacterium]|nr:hypothetical protein [Gaiellales bacterium]
PVEITRRPLATNHQGRVEWAEQARFFRTEERAEAIERLLAQPGMTPERLTEAFLREPVYGTRHAQGFGTVYTAAYRPAEAGLELRWPGEQPWRLSCASFRAGSRRISYAKSGAALPGIRRSPGRLPAPSPGSGLGGPRPVLDHGFSTVRGIRSGMFLWTCRRCGRNVLPVHALSASWRAIGQAPTACSGCAMA